MVAFAVDDEGMGLLHQAIQCGMACTGPPGTGELVIAEHLCPLLKSVIAGGDQRAMLVALTDTGTALVPSGQRMGWCDAVQVTSGTYEAASR